MQKLPESQLHKGSKTELSVAKPKKPLGVGEWGGGTPPMHILSEQGDKYSRIFLQISPYLQVFNQTPSNLLRYLQGGSQAYGLERLINKHVYKY